MEEFFKALWWSMFLLTCSLTPLAAMYIARHDASKLSVLAWVGMVAASGISLYCAMTIVDPNNLMWVPLLTGVIACLVGVRIAPAPKKSRRTTFESFRSMSREELLNWATRGNR